MLKPMLAHDASKHASKITYPCFVQPKLDGVRCIYQNGRFYTRNLKLINSCPELLEHVRELDEVFYRQWDYHLILDGELIRKDNDFQKTVSSVRKTVNIEHEDTTLRYRIFDFFDSKTPQATFGTRNAVLKSIILNNQKLHHRFRFVETFQVLDRDSLYKRYCEFLSHGHEGLMIRRDTPYEPDKRSFNLLKMKPTNTLEAKIINTQIGEGKYSATLGALCVRDCSSGIPFFVGSGFDDTQRYGLWTRRFEILGKIITVKHQGFTNDGTPRFPIFVDFRDYE